MLDTLKAVISLIKGSYTIGIISVYDPKTVYVVRKDNPLVIGLGNGQNFISSDYTADIEYTHSFNQLGEEEMSKITLKNNNLFNSNGIEIPKTQYAIEWDFKNAEKVDINITC